MKPCKISYFVTMGDSLSDRGTFYHRYLFGFIPLKRLSHLHEASPKGRFTNGFVWSDHVCAMLANESIIDELMKKRHLDSTDIADGIINHDPYIEHLVRQSYTLSDHQSIAYQGQDYVRNYNEAGTTAHDYHWTSGKNASQLLCRNLVSTLSDMRHKLLKHDETHQISGKQKAETLVIEWTGSNDFLLVDERPSKIQADKAIANRVENIKQLMQHGYRHFALLDLPDISLTPRYQQMSEEERINAHRCSIYFNKKLAEACKKIDCDYPDCSIEVFDVNTTFTNIVRDPEKYGFDSAKTKSPYIYSEDFKKDTSNKQMLPSAKKAMFWDDLHPTAMLHALIGEGFYKKFHEKYYFAAAKKQIKHPTETHTLEDAHTFHASKENHTRHPLLFKGLAATATLFGLYKASTSYGFSVPTSAATAGLITLGLFAARRPIESRKTETNQLEASAI